MARGHNVDEARKSLLKIKNDPRVPMMQIYALFAGQATPDDVLAAARAGNPSPQQLRERLFYAALYIGLYCEAMGDTERRPRTHLHGCRQIHDRRLHGRRGARSCRAAEKVGGRQSRRRRSGDKSCGHHDQSNLPMSG